jgi:hypothetical protein
MGGLDEIRGGCQYGVFENSNEPSSSTIGRNICCS